MKHCLVFASLISPSKMILFEKKYQTFDTVFHHQMKHCISCLIYYFKHEHSVLSSIVLNIELVHFVLQSCEILHSALGLYDKNSPSWYCFTSNVMFKWYKRLVYMHPDLLARFFKVNLSKAKNSA